MGNFLAKTISASIALQELEGAATPAEAGHASPISTAPIDAGAAPPAAIGAVPLLYRRVGRRTLRLLKPLAAPFLHRIDLRMRYAMDRSDSADVLRRMEKRLDEFGSGIGELSRGVGAITAAQNSAMQAMELQLSAVRLNVTHTAAQTQASLAAQQAAMQAMEQRLAEVGDIRRQSIAGLETRSELLVRYAESLLQRNVMPLGQELAVRTEAGYLLVPAEDPALLIALVETRGRLEPGTLAIVCSLLPGGGVLIDVGANIGGFTLPAARKVGAEGRVLALEPAPRIAALLKRTIALNEVVAWVDVQDCAAGDVEGTAQFGLSAQTTHNSLWPPDDTVQTIEVAVRLLDSLVPPGSRVDVVKIDAEGAELKVWRGMQRIVSDNPALAIVLEFGPEHLRRAGTTVAAWFDALTASGHVPWEIDEAGGSVRPLRQTGLDDVLSLNILLMRDHPASRGISVT